MISRKRRWLWLSQNFNRTFFEWKFPSTLSIEYSSIWQFCSWQIGTRPTWGETAAVGVKVWKEGQKGEEKFKRVSRLRKTSDKCVAHPNWHPSIHSVLVRWRSFAWKFHSHTHSHTHEHIFTPSALLNNVGVVEIFSLLAMVADHISNDYTASLTQTVPITTLRSIRLRRKLNFISDLCFLSFAFAISLEFSAVRRKW